MVIGNFTSAQIMKTKFYLGLAACVLLMANCSQEDTLIQDNYNTTISATIESAIKSRSTVTEGGEFAWAEGDEISVQKKDGGFATLVYRNNDKFGSKEDETSSTWKGVAYYPANDRHNANQFVLPASYTLGTNTLNTHAPMKADVAESNSPNLSFKHLGGVLRFKFRNVPATANKFVFTTDKGITGTFDIISSGNGEVIEASNNATNNNTISFNFEANQSSEMTFYVPMPVGTYNSMTVALYDNSNTELWKTSSTATNEVRRALLLLMPPLNCTKNSATASSSNAVSNALQGNKTEASVNLSGDAVQMDEITIPESFTSANGESNLNLTYNTIPEASGEITISDANSNAEQTESKGNVSISIPNVSDESEAPSFNINLPTMTVTLEANIENAIYNEVTASTAKNTLRIGKGVTVKKLILNGGNIIIEEGAYVESIKNANNYNTKTYIVIPQDNQTKDPKLENVVIVNSEEEIPTYVLRVLTFEDEDAQFEPYWLDYVDYWSGKEIRTWSDLIDSPQYSGPMMYGNDATDAMYYWHDTGNTELYHMFPNNYAYCYWGGGHAISNYWGKGYADEDRNSLIAKYYGQEYVDKYAGKPGADAYLGWFCLQLMTPVSAHSGDNFVVHYGYKDDYSYIENLPELSFYDCEPRVIDHMYVTNTNYTLNQLHNGVKSEEGNSFGGDWSGLTEDAWLKIVAYGYENIDDNPDEPTSEVEFYLVRGFNVVETWQKWDLSGLGKVAKVRFNFLYSENMGGDYGFTIPGYFAYDDIAVRFEK